MEISQPTEVLNTRFLLVPAFMKERMTSCCGSWWSREDSVGLLTFGVEEKGVTTCELCEDSAVLVEFFVWFHLRNIRGVIVLRRRSVCRRSSVKVELFDTNRWGSGTVRASSEERLQIWIWDIRVIAATLQKNQLDLRKYYLSSAVDI